MTNVYKVLRILYFLNASRNFCQSADPVGADLWSQFFFLIFVSRECVSTGAVGAQTRRFLGHHLLPPLILRLLVLWAPAVLRTSSSRMHLHPQIQIPNAFPVMSTMGHPWVICGLSGSSMMVIFIGSSDSNNWSSGGPQKVENSISILLTFNGIHDVPKRKSKKLLLIMKVEKSINVKPYNFFYLIIITKQYPKLDHIFVSNT